MKWFVSMICGCCLFFVTAVAQPMSISISTDKTVSLVFPFPIIHVDRGAKEVLAQQIKSAANILLLKTATSDLKETNLSVITEDGNVYSFALKYEESPACWVYEMSPMSDEPVATYAKAIIDNPTFLRGV